MPHSQGPSNNPILSRILFIIINIMKWYPKGRRKRERLGFDVFQSMILQKEKKKKEKKTERKTGIIGD